MVLRYNGASIAAAVMIASLERNVAHASRQIFDTSYEWSCDDTAENHNLDLVEIRTPIGDGAAVSTAAVTTREKVASVYIADTCSGEYRCDVRDQDMVYTTPQCRACCEKHWAPFGKDFVEALERASLDERWADKIAACAFVADIPSNRPAKDATELTAEQVKALGDLHEIVEEVASSSYFQELDDTVQERIIEKASLIFAETFLRLKRNDLWRTKQHAPMDDPEKRCSEVYNAEFRAIQKPASLGLSDSGRNSFRVEEGFFSPRFSFAETPSTSSQTSRQQSSLAFLWDLGPFAKTDSGASSRQQEIPCDEQGKQENLDKTSEGPPGSMPAHSP